MLLLRLNFTYNFTAKYINKLTSAENATNGGRFLSADDSTNVNFRYFFFDECQKPTFKETLKCGKVHKFYAFFKPHIEYFQSMLQHSWKILKLIDLICRPYLTNTVCINSNCLQHKKIFTIKWLGK